MNVNKEIWIIREHLNKVKITLQTWLTAKMERISSLYFLEYIKPNLTPYQLSVYSDISSIGDLDLSALLRITIKCWNDLSMETTLYQEDKNIINDLGIVISKFAGTEGFDLTENDFNFAIVTLRKFFKRFDPKNLQLILNLKEIEILEEETTNIKLKKSTKSKTQSDVIMIGSLVSLISKPDRRGIVIDIKTNAYIVYINDNKESWYKEQTKLEMLNHSSIVSVQELLLKMTANQTMNPDTEYLYSLNSARIDFVPYQFRPAIKLINSDTNGILIADGVGVGKTIEAGLVLKEMQARTTIEKVCIICPKPLVAEKKWENEMRRFDEEFTPIDGKTFRALLNEYNRSGELHEKYNKIIIPFSILQNEEFIMRHKGKKHVGLYDLDPSLHFDMLIVDEAHHIRNRDTNTHNAVKYFADHSDIVVFLTATPIQTSDRNLYTLLNVLAPDLIIDEATFDLIMEPNVYITKAIKLIKSQPQDWVSSVLTELDYALATRWGKTSLIGNPVVTEIRLLLNVGNEITREQKVSLISNFEKIHTLANLINRTRRLEIGDFTIRNTHAISNKFTQEQAELYQKLLLFQTRVFQLIHATDNIKFMMSTLTRQASSCIFGLGDHIKDIIQRNFDNLDEYDIDYNDVVFETTETIVELADELISLSKKLPTKDNKYDDFLTIVNEKQKQDNNKIMVFSSFRHTLSYLRRRFVNEGLTLRFAQIDGSVKDEDRYDISRRFALPKENPQALDVVFFTEVGSEGLDYQFCNMMINYDLPWNPMRIEQRIGRIDRRGQASPTVAIYNLITDDTLDQTIYNRCLERIGVFEKSLGESSEILGRITNSIFAISFDMNLTEEQKASKLEQMTLNEIAKIKELEVLEEKEKEIFGIDINEQLQGSSDNGWVSSRLLQQMIESYFLKQTGINPIQGVEAFKNLRLSNDNKQRILKDLQKLPKTNSLVYRQWSRFLRSNETNVRLTFEAETARDNRDALFITISHPLARQAAKSIATNDELNFSAKIVTNELAPGMYPFSVYEWKYLDIREKRKLVIYSIDDLIKEELVDLLKKALDSEADIDEYSAHFESFDEQNKLHWNKEKEEFVAKLEQSTNYKISSLEHSFMIRSLRTTGEIESATNDKIRLMKEAQLVNLKNDFEEKKKRLEELPKKADILQKLLVRGVLIVESEEV